MRAPEDHQRRVADMLERAGMLISGITALGGEQGILAGSAVRTFLSTAAQMMRQRGVTVDDMVSHMKKIGPVNMPWPEGKVTGKDPA